MGHFVRECTQDANLTPSHRQASPYTGSRDPGSEVIIDRVLQQVDEGTEKA